MSELGNDLRAIFPAQVDILHTLKLESAAYRSAAQRYHDLTHEIGRLDSGLEGASDVRLEELKKDRLSLLDDIAEMIALKLEA